jgi:hypothetical protein
MSRIGPVTARPARNDKYPVNSLHRSQFVKNVSLAVLFDCNSNSCTVSTHSDVYINTSSAQYGDAGRVKEILKIGTTVNAACHRFVSPVLYHVRPLVLSHSANRRSGDTDSCVIHMLQTVAIQCVVVKSKESFRTRQLHFEKQFKDTSNSFRAAS